MRPTLVTTALGRRGRRALAVTLAAAAGVSGALANDAQAANIPLNCEIVLCPNLTILSVYGGGGVAWGYVIVKNDGPWRAPRATALSIVRVSPYRRELYYVPALFPGETYRIDHALCSDVHDPDWKIEVDPRNLVRETREWDNDETESC